MIRPRWSDVGTATVVFLFLLITGICLRGTAGFVLAMGAMAVIFVWAPIATVYNGVMFAKEIKRMRRRREGRCVTCGYDLRASRDRCPECGRSIDDEGLSE